MGQHATGEELTELAFDERGQATGLLARLGRAEKGLEMLLNDTVKHGVLGVAWAIHRLGGRHAQQYRARGALPMPKDGYAGSGRTRDGAASPVPARGPRLGIEPDLGQRARN
jgi:hypothetical protein